MKRPTTKLIMRRETVRALSMPDLRAAIGGDGYTDGCYPTKTCPDPQSPAK